MYAIVIVMLALGCASERDSQTDSPPKDKQILVDIHVDQVKHTGGDSGDGTTLEMFAVTSLGRKPNFVLVSGPATYGSLEKTRIGLRHLSSAFDGTLHYRGDALDNPDNSVFSRKIWIAEGQFPKPGDELNFKLVYVDDTVSYSNEMTYTFE